mmetsp:Transcript_69769/g.181779  ORF Transcript_69769/g.181779 Transcript_69769/m.181779 type:complete len:200 (+) Transcript_69769:454-1053(+)
MPRDSPNYRLGGFAVQGLHLRNRQRASRYLNRWKVCQPRAQHRLCCRRDVLVLPRARGVPSRSGARFGGVGGRRGGRRVASELDGLEILLRLAAGLPLAVPVPGQVLRLLVVDHDFVVALRPGGSLLAVLFLIANIFLWLELLWLLAHPLVELPILSLALLRAVLRLLTDAAPERFHNLLGAVATVRLLIGLLGRGMLG